MSDSNDWQGEAPQPMRKGPPKWMIVTGCGCLIPGFLMIAIAAWGMQFFATATNPRLSYEALAAVLPFDESLKGRETGLADDPGTRAVESHESPKYPLLFGTEIPFSGGVGLFYLARGATVFEGKITYADDTLIAMITKAPSDQSGAALRGNGEGVPFTLDVQGTALSGLRFEAIESDVILEFPKGTTKVKGPGVAMRLRSDVAQDLEDPESKRFDVLLTLQRPVAGGGPVTDDEVREFLAPFHIGPAR